MKIPELYKGVIDIARRLAAAGRWLVTYAEFFAADEALALLPEHRHSALRFAHAIGEIFYLESDDPELTGAPQFKIVVDIERFSLLISRIVSSSNKAVLREQGTHRCLRHRSDSHHLRRHYRHC